MIDLTTDCPNCGSENAYHDGVEYECPECDYTWGADEIDYDNVDDDEDDNFK